MEPEETAERKMENPEIEAHASHHKTGIRWLDASLALSAFAISVISLYVAIHHGQTMKEMAEANARMVAASSWPFVEFASGNLNDKGQQEVSLSVANQGVGPARIERLEVRYKGKPMHSTQDLMTACCATGPDELRAVFNNSDFKSALITTPIEGRILAAREERSMLRLPKTANNSKIFEQLDVGRWQLEVRICFCSVFDECWTSAGKRSKATRVTSCPQEWVSFRE